MSLPGFLSLLLGWLYTALWSLSFYPQALTNQRRQSSRGFSTDFAYLNPLGFWCYSANQLALLLNEAVRKDYRDGHKGLDPTVQWNDVAFAVHAAIVSTFTLGQKVWFGARQAKQERERRECLGEQTQEQGQGSESGHDGSSEAAITEEGSSRLPSRPALITISLILLTILLTTLLSLSHAFGVRSFAVVDVLAAAKLYITLTKWIPQVVLNYRRKSTIGFNVHSITLDMAGGVLSFAQLCIDARWIQGSWDGVTGNPGKL